ncbi:MAG: lipoyl synthase [Acidimicrobiales bacterium]
MRVRWLGRVPYEEALAVQRALFEHGRENHLLLLEHPHVYTLGRRGDAGHVLVPPASVGADLVRTNRGGDVTYHGPGQLVGYPILSGMADTVAYVTSVEQIVIDSLRDLGLTAARLNGYPGVWIDADGNRPRKIAAIGVRLSRGRTMHGFALNVSPNLSMFDHIVPCGITDKGVTSIAAEGIDVSMERIVDIVSARASAQWSSGHIERQDVAWHRPAGVTTGLSISARKPSWMRAPLRMGPDYMRLKSTMRELSLVTVCEEAGCPNISECWGDGTATFMVLGDRCTRACGFCLIDTSKPLPPDPHEPEHVAEAVLRMGLRHAVVTMVARDDLADGGASVVAATIEAIRRQSPSSAVEVLIADLKGSADSLEVVFEAKPDVVNHNVETVPRLQRAVRPSAGYARSLGVLARATRAGFTTKSGIVVGMGETDDEVIGVLADLASIGVDIVTIGQYLRPTNDHLPVARWVTPETFGAYREAGEAFGIGHVESSPLTRSSYHARQAAEDVIGVPSST